jgi:hypothetical protein
MPGTFPNLPHDHQPGVNSYADGKGNPLLLLYAPLQWPESLNDAQARAHGTLCIVFVRPWIAKIDQHPIAQILGDMPVKALHDLGTDRMIGSYHRAQLFEVQMYGKSGRIDEVTK